VHELEGIAHAAFRAFYGDRALETHGATCFRLDEAPESPMLNRVVGLGLGEPASDEAIDAALAAMDGVSCYVAISPFASPADLGQRLSDRGLEPGWGWMLFERDASPPAPVETGLRIVEVAPGEAEPWARVVATAYGLPDAVVPVTAATPERPGWTCWLALDGDEPASAAALWAEGEVGYLGFAGTMPASRGKGGQGALFATRIERARELGCTTLVTETGEQIPDRPSSSYRNILRFGFRERFVVHHRLRSATPTHGREMPYDV
jgi:GNAT superfamily N-acetyltransferase